MWTCGQRNDSYPRPDGAEQDHVRFHHATQRSTQFKTYGLFISGRLQVTKQPWLRGITVLTLVLNFAYLNVYACLNKNSYEMYWAFGPLDNSWLCLGFFDVPQGGKEDKRQEEHRWQKPRRPDEFLLFIQLEFLFKGSPPTPPGTHLT